MKRRKLKDKECMDRNLWRRKIISLGWGKLCIHGKTSKNKNKKSEGRAGIAWEPYKYMMPPPPPPPINKSVSHFSPNIFSLLLLFCYPSDLSLSLFWIHRAKYVVANSIRTSFNDM
jgi:hypothetical protein